jgi:Arrestin (or S-antigen), N-terminal domain
VHQYPFTFHVPKNLPPSLKTPMGEVNHRLRASLKRPGHVPNIIYKMARAKGYVKSPLIVYNSDHTSPHDHSHNSLDPTDPPAYRPSNRREWCGQRRNGQIDWLLQGPASVHLSSRVDIVAKLKISKGHGVVSTATVDLQQVEKYKAEPDPTVWTFPIQRVDGDDDEDDGNGSGSDDGFPETRVSGVTLKQAVVFNPYGVNGLNAHCRENVCSLVYYVLMKADDTT